MMVQYTRIFHFSQQNIIYDEINISEKEKGGPSPPILLLDCLAYLIGMQVCDNLCRASFKATSLIS